MEAEAETAPAHNAQVDLITRLVIPVVLAVCIIAVWVGLLGLQDQTKDLTARLASAEAAAGKSNDRVAALEKANADALAQNKALEARIADASAAAAKSADGVAALTTTLTAAQTDAKALSDNVAALAKSGAATDDATKGLDGRLGVNEAQSQALEARIASGEAAAKAIADRVNTAEALLADASASVAKLNDFASSVNARTDAVSTALAAASAAFQQANAALSDLATAEKKTEERAAGIESSVAKLNSDEGSVKSAVAWRELSQDTQSALVKQVASTSDAAVDISYLAGDTESHAYAMQLGKAFKAGGWYVSYTQATYPSSMITGVIVDQSDDRATSAIEAAFKATGVDYLAAKLPEAEDVVTNGRREDSASVLVGSHAVRF